MLHVDEGQLHALLDGAFNEAEAQALHDHISACAQCAAQLEEARALRTRSAALLSAAQPARLGTPPFESVLAQANKSGPGRRTWFAQYPLAQAALLVLALGVGWLSRGLAMNGAMRADRAVSREEASEPTAPAPAAAPLVATPPPPSANEPAGNTRSTPEQERRNAQAFPAAAPLADRAVDASAKLSQSKDERAAERKVVGAAAEAGLQSLGQRQAQAPPPVQQQAQQQNVARDVQMAARVQAAAPAAAGAIVVAEGNSPLRWQYVSVERAEQITGRRVLRVPDLDIVNVGVASAPTGYVVLLNQRLADGAILELQQRAEALAQRERVENEAVELLKERAAAEFTGSNTASLQRAGLVITARGFVSADSLRALLQRMR